VSTPCWVFDLDGTLADLSHRLHFIEGDTKDWRAFFAAVADDKPIPHMVKLARDLACFGPARVAFVSGRSDECRGQTLTWLFDHIRFSLPLYMRRAGDHRPDEVVKIELLAQLRADGFEPIMVFDDRSRVVAAWRAAGIPCAQVAPGDF
jgi:phosphoglycolate phosphatase-like HAD superfamily hydrolase